MDPIRLPESLVEAGVLVVTEPDEIELTAEYIESVEQYQQQSLDECVERIRKQRDDAEGVLAELESTDPKLAAHLCVLAERITESSFEGLIRVGLVVQALADGPPPTAGVPEGFVPIRGSQLASILRLYRQAIIYIWRQECPPCDVVRDELEELNETLIEDMGQFAVYGPECATHLQEAYDVTGGPALLFVADGAVRSRLYGAQHAEVIASEIRTLGD